MTVASSLIERYQNVMFPAAAPYHGDHPVVVDHAKDQYIWDVEGKRYLDFFGGVLTVSVGHCNDEVMERTIEQLRTVQHTTTIYINEIMVTLAEKVVALTPSRLQKVFFTSSGTEANETAILAARMYTGNPTVITLRYAYSGRSMLAMTMTANGNWRLGGVVDPYVRHVRAPYEYRAPAGLTQEQLIDLCVQDLEETLATVTDGRIAAFIAEPIQGVGGFIVLPPEYLRRVAPIVRAAGGVFISDEVQTGWGRTGSKWFGIEHSGVEPDIMTFAKGMANGMPIGCTVTTPEIAEAVKGATFSTFGGNPVVMATSLATIEYIEKYNLAENAAVQGGRLRSKLEELQSEFKFIGDVRGMGLMQGLEIVNPLDNSPDTHLASALMNAAKDRGLLVGKGGRYNNVLRIAPHLNVSAEDIDIGAEIIAKACLDIS